MNEYDRYLTNIDKIYNYYGYEPQLNKLVEEIGELLIAISKKDEVNMWEEMADVMVILDQFKQNSKYEEFQGIQFAKAQRQVNRIEETEKKIFTREEIGKMTTAEFIKNEAAINEQIKNGLF